MFGTRAALTIPPAAKADPQSLEILRVWVAGGAQHVSLKTEVWEDPAAWGLMLADLAGHIANAYAAGGRDREEAFERVLAGLRAELDSPTDEPQGELLL